VCQWCGKEKQGQLETLCHRYVLGRFKANRIKTNLQVKSYFSNRLKNNSYNLRTGERERTSDWPNYRDGAIFDPSVPNVLELFILNVIFNHLEIFLMCKIWSEYVTMTTRGLLLEIVRWTVTVSTYYMALALSAKAISVSAPSVWNSLSLDCRSAQLASLFGRSMLQTELFSAHWVQRVIHTVQSGLWNSLPRDITECQTVEAFKRKL